MADKEVYGLSKKGFKRKRLPEITADMFNRFEDKTGMKVNREPDSVLGVIFNVVGYEIADLWSSAADTYNAMYPHTADGVSLNNAATLAGIIPRSATATEVYLTCYGIEGTTIPKGSIVASSTDSDSTYSAVEDSHITLSNTSHVVIRTPSIVVAGSTYTVRVGTSTSTYISKSGDFENIILLNLKNSIQDSSVVLELNDDGLHIMTAKKNIGISISISSTLQVTKMASPVLFRSNINGAITPITGDVTSIITNIDGWESCTNEVDATVGSDVESDNALRLRWNSSLYRRGTANIDSIQGNLLNNIKGVTSCRVFENVSDTVDEDGRLPHSIEVVIAGGDELEIANEIWRLKGAGIDTNGDISVEIKDSQNVSHEMKFNRPSPVKVWLKVTLTKLDEEEWGHTNRTKAIESILNTANKLQLGQDVVLQRFVGDIYKNTNGVGSITIEATTGDTASRYSANNISIGVRQIADISEARIEVIEHV